MNVILHLYTQSKPIYFKGVSNAYQKGDLYCVLLENGDVHKFPLIHIFRTVESLVS